jgi:DNA-binding CsgD family transcriptional regulator
MTAWGIVEATERLYRSLFTAAVLFALGTVIWGLAIAPFNAFDHHHARSVVLGTTLTIAAAGAVAYRLRIYRVLRRHPELLLAIVAIGVAALWIDGGWRSSYYLASYSALAFAAVVAGRRWGLACGVLLAAGYVGGLLIHGYSWGELERLKDADSVVANTGGYLIAGYFFATPVAWLGGYVARIQQVAGAPAQPPTAAPAPGLREQPRRIRTKYLSAREIQVVQLAATGLTNEAIADRLGISPRTVQTQLRNAMKKTGAKNRAELTAIAALEGLLPPDVGR